MNNVTDAPDKDLRPERYLGTLRRLRDWAVWNIACLRGTPKVMIGNNKMVLHRFDKGISKELFVYRTHEPRATSVYKGLVYPGMIVVDIGSNIGYYALIASDLVGHEGHVIAIEPEPRNYHLLRDNSWKRANMTVLPLAIGDVEGSEKLYLSDRSNTHSMIPTYSLKSTTVRTTTLDTLIEGLGMLPADIGLVRMDVEGYEINVLAGMRDILRASNTRLIMELHCDVMGYEKTIALLRNLNNMGYCVMSVVDRDADFAYVKSEIAFMSTSELISCIRKYRVLSVAMEKRRRHK